MKRILAACLLALSLNLAANEIDTWDTPVTISSTMNNASNPSILQDAVGNAVAIWLEEGMSGTTLVAKTKSWGMPWTSATTLSSNSPSEPQLAIDPAGNATAIWQESGNILTNSMPSGGSWGMTAITLDGSGAAFSPQVALDPTSGDAVAVWVTFGMTNFVINSNTRTAGTWSMTTDTLSNTSLDSNAPQVAIGTGETVAAVWHTHNTSPTPNIFNVNAATKTMGGSWSTASLVSNPNQNSVFPQVAVDSNGNAGAIWFTYLLTEYVVDAVSADTYSNVIVQSSYLPNGLSWSNPVNISSTGVENPAKLDATIKFGASGKAVGLWTNSADGAIFFLETSQTDSNQNWMPPVTLTDNLYSQTINCALNSIDDTFGIYTEQDFMNNLNINTIESHVGGFNGGFWTSPVIISTGTENAFPQITAGITGGSNCFAAAAWVNYDTTDMVTVIQSSIGTGTAVVPPSNVMVTQSSNDFNVFTEYFNTITWDASTDPNLNGYAIYRNGVLIAFVPDSAMPLEYIDNNRVQSGQPGSTVIYSVTAVDTSDTESTAVSSAFPPP